MMTSSSGKQTSWRKISLVGELAALARKAKNLVIEPKVNNIKDHCGSSLLEEQILDGCVRGIEVTFKHPHPASEKERKSYAKVTRAPPPPGLPLLTEEQNLEQIQCLENDKFENTNTSDFNLHDLQTIIKSPILLKKTAEFFNLPPTIGPADHQGTDCQEAEPRNEEDVSSSHDPESEPSSQPESATQTLKRKKAAKNVIKLTERSNVGKLADQILPQLNTMQKNLLGLLFFNELSSNIVEDMVTQRLSMMPAEQLAQALQTLEQEVRHSPPVKYHHPFLPPDVRQRGRPAGGPCES